MVIYFLQSDLKWKISWVFFYIYLKSSFTMHTLCEANFSQMNKWLFKQQFFQWADLVSMACEAFGREHKRNQK